MTELSRQRDVSAVEVEAASWIAQLNDHSFTDTDLEALREWCDRSPLHRQTLKRLGDLWSELDVLSSLPEELMASRPDRQPKSKLRWNMFWIGHAATAGVAILAFAIWFI